MILVDTHAHLYAEQFDEDREQMLQRARDLGVKHFVLPAIDRSTHQRMLDLEAAHADCYAMIGLHPTSVGENVAEELAHVRACLDQRDFVGVGEIGIDLYWDKTFLKQQQDAFKTQIEWAKALNKPIAIHCREAFDEIFEVLEDCKGPELHGIFHCFSGTEEHAKLALDYNMHLGIGGVVTFKNGKIDQFLHQVPLERIVLETDAPYLAPVPYRGKRNESAYVLEVAEKLATIYQKGLDEIAAITTANAKGLFNLK